MSDGIGTERACGACTACCVVPPINEPEIRKPASTPCRYCAAGCTIYDRRPQMCRDFNCAWRRLPDLGVEWRPDRSGVLITMEADTRKTSPAMMLMLIADPLKTVRDPAFLAFVQARILQNITVFLALPAPPGHLPIRTCVNSPQMTSAARRSPGKVKEILEQALRFLRTQNFPPDGLAP